MQVSLTLNDVLPQTTRDLLLSRYKLLKEPEETLEFILDYNDILTTTVTGEITTGRERAEKYYNSYATCLGLTIVSLLIALVTLAGANYHYIEAWYILAALEFVPCIIMLLLTWHYGTRHRDCMNHVRYLENVVATLPRRMD